MCQERLQQNYSPQEFTEIIMRYTLQQWQMLNEAVPEDLIKPPANFTTATKWREFSKSFITFMQHSKGQCDFPLSYVLRENDEPYEPEDNDDTYETQEALEEAMIPLTGAYYDMDNHSVFDSLKSRLLNGPAWTWIQDFERRHDGCSAWKALQAHYEGASGQI
jgi:hypothetical protein